jgi:hypothetical protein
MFAVLRRIFFGGHNQSPFRKILLASILNSKWNHFDIPTEISKIPFGVLLEENLFGFSGIVQRHLF